jgi:peptidoglycan/LPS O-acetylase OafA/YrhL
MTRRHIISHTSLRGVAALLVVFYHLQFGAHFRFAWETATPFFKTGYLWVDLFFILSGFVISYSARADERAPYAWPEIRTFWIARFARIYPLHFFCLLACLVIQVGMHMIGRGTPGSWSPGSWLNFVEQLFLLNAWGITGRVGWNIPSWSISAEMFAYLLFPALATLLVRGGRLAPLLFLAFAAAFYGWVASTSGNLDIVKGLAILRCLSGFSLGMLIFLWRGRFEQMSDGLLSLLQSIGLMLALATLLFGLNDVVAIPGFFLLVAATWPDRGWLARPLALRPLVWLGEISYSVYLVHVVLIQPWNAYAPGLFGHFGITDPAMTRAGVIIGAVVAVLCVAMLTYRLIELPARQTIIGWFDRRRASGLTSSLRAPDLVP